MVFLLKRAYKLLDETLILLKIDLKMVNGLLVFWGNLKVKVDEITAIENKNILFRDLKYLKSTKKRFVQHHKFVKEDLNNLVSELMLPGSDTFTDLKVDNLMKKLSFIGPEVDVLSIKSSDYFDKLWDLLAHFERALNDNNLEQIHQVIMEMGEVLEMWKKNISQLIFKLLRMRDFGLPAIENEMKRHGDERNIIN